MVDITSSANDPPEAIASQDLLSKKRENNKSQKKLLKDWCSDALHELGHESLHEGSCDDNAREDR